LKNNLLRDNKYGIFGDASSEGVPSLTKYTPNAYVQANAIGGAQASVYPTGNDYPSLAQWLADFVNRGAADYRLVASSQSNNAATDGKDIGVDFTELNAAMAGTTGSSSPPPSGGSTTPFSGTPVSIPGKVQFENYDVGGKEVAYHDTSGGNRGSVYRDNSVDIQATSDSGGGYNIGWVAAGEWLKYTVNVTAAATYRLDVRVAQKGSGGRFHVEVDGSDKTGAITAPNTGGWQTWQTVGGGSFSLTAGVHVVRVVMDANGSGGFVSNFNWFSLTTSSTSTASDTQPYSGSPVSLPGKVSFENYDVGGKEVAYHDTTPGNTGGAYRGNSVDIEPTSDSGGGYNVGWVSAGEWLKYTVAIAAARSYALDVRVAQEGNGGAFHVEVDGVDKTGRLTVPSTGSWQAWQTMTKGNVALSAGTHVVRVVMDSNGSSGSVANFNWFAIR
ncbi:MAG TPA: carbohydrate-binding protein, partial [Micromonosporaceae bacterium]